MRAIIHDGNSNAVGFNCRTWVANMDGDIFEGTYPNAVRVARKIIRDGRRIFVSTNYGLTTQVDREIMENGDIGPQLHPNEVS